MGRTPGGFSVATFSPLLIEQVEGSDHGRQLFRLVKPLTFHVGINGGGIKLTVPAGETTDFASVPRILWPICPPTGPWGKATVVHDWLCRLPGCSRFLADAIFREAMAELGIPVWRRVLMYYAVRFYGALFARKKP